MKVQKVHTFLTLAVILLAAAGGVGSVRAISPEDTDASILEYTVFLPLAHNSAPILHSTPILLGIYPQEWPGTQAVMDDEFHSLDDWAGKRLSLAGTFVDFVDPDIGDLDHYFVNITHQLGVLRDNEYTPFMNLNTQHPGYTAQYIASGGADNYIRLAAQAFNNYTQNGTRMAFIAPLQEMNINAVVYGDPNPVYYINAFRRFQQIFAQEGVQDQSVVWVFAPNGPSSSGYPGFEAYYPGDEDAEAVAISGYHVGYCPWADPSWQSWQGPQAILGQFLERMSALAPEKPLFVAQTGTTIYNLVDGEVVPDYASKDQWLYDAYTYLADYPNLFGVLYYNRWADTEGCEWAFYNKDGDKFDGYRRAVANPAYQYLSPEDLMQDFP